MFKVNNRNTRTRCAICSKLTTYSTTCSTVSIVNFEQVNTGWVFRFIQAYAVPYVTLAYSLSYPILSPGIFRTENLLKIL